MFAGPSYEVRCTDPARNTELFLFDANPSNGLMGIEGTHHQLPEGMNRFTAEISAGPLALDVVRYQPYEVELRVNAEDQDAMLVANSNESAMHIGRIDRLLIENHSNTLINDTHREGAVVLALATGLSLRFTHCVMNGDTSILDWSGTFNQMP